MNIPGYDAWRLQGPEERDDPEMEQCPWCEGDGAVPRGRMEVRCAHCNGSGEVEVEIEEPDGDYLYEQMRDRRME